MNATTDRTKAMKSACKIIQEQIQRDWGNGWKNLGDPIKEAIITERVFYIFTGRDDESRYSVKELRDYNDAVLFHFGLRD